MTEVVQGGASLCGGRLLSAQRLWLKRISQLQQWLRSLANMELLRPNCPVGAQWESARELEIRVTSLLLPKFR